MCEIFLIVKPDNKTITKKEIGRFLKACLPASYTNSDGWGAVWENGFIKSPKQFKGEDIKDILKGYKPSRFFSLHLRLATSKVNYDNTHPFKLQNFIGVHNGVVHVDGYNTGVDSHDMFKMIQDAEGKNLGQKIINGMRKVTGSYSCLLYDYKGKKLYYYRNNRDFDFMLSKKDNMIYGATNIDRLRYIFSDKTFGYFETSIIDRPRSEVVYQIDLETGNFKRVGEIDTDIPVVKMKSSDDRASNWQSRVYGGYRFGYDNDSYGGW